jgi:hypothetical protein
MVSGCLIAPLCMRHGTGSFTPDNLKSRGRFWDGEVWRDFSRERMARTWAITRSSCSVRWTALPCGTGFLDQGCSGAREMECGAVGHCCLHARKGDLWPQTLAVKRQKRAPIVTLESRSQIPVPATPFHPGHSLQRNGNFTPWTLPNVRTKARSRARDMSLNQE